MIYRDGADEEGRPADDGVAVEGVELISELVSISFGCAMLFALLYTQELKFTFEFFQKVLMNLDGNKVSPKVQTLKIKTQQWAPKYSAGQLGYSHILAY